MLAVNIAPALIPPTPENRMRRPRLVALFLCLAAASPFAVAQKVVDVPTRPGVTQRFLYIAPPAPKAAVILFAGGDGGLQIGDNGNIEGLKGNFLVRTRQLFADQGLAVAVVDAPSDRQRHPFLIGYRQTAEHAADVKVVIAWLREQLKVPVWLVGTSRGTQSAAYIATQLMAGGGPDGIVLTSSMLTDPRSRPVPNMPLETLKIPVLVVHHEEDGCRHCLYSDMSRLMEKLAGLPRKQLVTFKGGDNVGDPCEARAYHGFNGLETQVVGKIAAWITTPP